MADKTRVAAKPSLLDLDLHEDDQLDEAQVATWIRQAAAMPGWGLSGS